MPGADSSLAQTVFVAFRVAADERFAQPPVGMENHLVVPSRDGVDGEGDAGCGGIEQRHDHHRHAGGFQAQLLPVGAGLRRPLRIPDPAGGVDRRIRPAHVQAGKMDARERRARGVFQGRGRTQGQRPIQPARAASSSRRAWAAAGGNGWPGSRSRLSRAGSTKPSGTGTPSCAKRPSCQPLPPAARGPAWAAAVPIQHGGSHAAAPARRRARRG